MPTYDIWFRAALDAINGINYRLYGDEETAGTFAELVASQAGISPFAPVSTPLLGNIGPLTTDRTIGISGTNFAENDIIQLDRETIKLGPEESDQFTNCIRGWGGASIPQAHTAGATVYKMHEKFTRTYAFPTSPYIRRVVRYKVARLDGAGEESVVSWASIYNHPKPPGIDWCTVWGTIFDYLAAMQTAVDGVLDVAGHGGFLVTTGDVLKDLDPEADSNADGYFYAFVPRGVSFIEKPVIELHMPSTGTIYKRRLTTVPDEDFCHWWRCSEAI